MRRLGAQSQKAGARNKMVGDCEITKVGDWSKMIEARIRKEGLGVASS